MSAESNDIQPASGTISPYSQETTDLSPR